MGQTLYQIKVYDRTNSVLKETISPKKVISDMSFSMNLDGGLGEQKIELNEPITTTKYTYGDIVKISMFNENNKQGKTIYTGYVTKLIRHQTTTKQTMELNCLGVASLFTEQRALKSITGLLPGQAIMQMVDEYNANYGNVFSYIAGVTIDNGPSHGGTSQLESTYLGNMKNLATRCKFNLFIDGEGVVRFKDRTTATKHYLTNQKDVESIDIEEDLEGVENSVRVSDVNYDSVLVEDATSIALYGKKRSNVKSNSRGIPYLQSYADNYLADHKDPKREVKIVVNRNYNLESIKPGDVLKVRNFPLFVDDVRILKVNYTPDKAVLFLEEYTSFGKEVLGDNLDPTAE